MMELVLFVVSCVCAGIVVGYAAGQLYYKIKNK